MKLNLNSKLPSAFYQDNVNAVAVNLLGKIFVKKEGNKILAGRIVETEAYDGVDDEASHSFNGMTNRNRVMFLAGGHLYVYFTYGVHFCCNVVTGPEGYGAAVLIRGIEPLQGIEYMSEYRFKMKSLDEKQLINLTNGPGKICQAFDISRRHDGTDLTGDLIFILDSDPVPQNEAVISKRIGIKKSADFPWRYYINSKYVSKK